MSDDLRDRIAALLELLRPVTPTEAADAVIRELGLETVELLARSWYRNYDIIPANDPRKPTDADIAYNDAGLLILDALGLPTGDPNE